MMRGFMRMTAPGVALASVYWLAGLSSAQTMFRGNPVHTGVYIGAGPDRIHSVKWKFTTGGRVISSPVVDQGLLYFGSGDHNVYAVDGETGHQKWKFSTGGPVDSTPAVAGGVVYFGSYDGKFYAVDARSGTLKWKFNTEGERRFEAKGLHGMSLKTQTVADSWDVFLSSPVVAGGMVLFGSGDTNLYALDADTGALRWKFATGDVIHSSPAHDGRTVYFGSWDSYLYAVDAASGKEKWRFKTGEDPQFHNQVGFQGSPAVVDGVVYVGCRDSNLYAVDAVTGKEKWKFNNKMSWVVNSPSVTSDRVIFGTSDSSLFHSLDRATGKPVFSLPMKAYVFSSPAVTGGIAYVGLVNGSLAAVDLQAGKLLWEFQADSARQNKQWILTSDGKLNIPMVFRNEVLDAVALSTNRLFSIGSVLSSPLVINGVVFFGSTEGNVYAIE